MKALIFRETGEPKSVLQMAEIPTPPLAAGEALVRVLLSPINASDLHMVRGRYGYQPELPASPGIEGVGIVEAVGPGVQDPRVGTRVVFIGTWHTCASGSCAQWTDSCPFQMAWTIRPPPLPTSIL
jgi:NADPH:quinone reductase-like Zn-dependent oxidoreductase